MEHRVSSLEKMVGDLRVSNAQTATQLGSLESVVRDDLVPAVRELTDTINKSKGALWFAGGLGGVLGWLASMFRTHP